MRSDSMVKVIKMSNSKVSLTERSGSKVSVRSSGEGKKNLTGSITSIRSKKSTTGSRQGSRQGSVSSLRKEEVQKENQEYSEKQAGIQEGIPDVDSRQVEVPEQSDRGELVNEDDEIQGADAEEEIKEVLNEILKDVVGETSEVEGEPQGEEQEERTGNDINNIPEITEELVDDEAREVKHVKAAEVYEDDEATGTEAIGEKVEEIKEKCVEKNESAEDGGDTEQEREENIAHIAENLEDSNQNVLAIVENGGDTDRQTDEGMVDGKSEEGGSRRGKGTCRDPKPRSITPLNLLMDQLYLMLVVSPTIVILVTEL